MSRRRNIVIYLAQSVRRLEGERDEVCNSGQAAERTGPKP
jgi:hypothetical protein